MTFFRQKTRTRFNTSIEFAAKRLPAHPVSRYGSFSWLWKATRKTGGYVPWPKNNSDDLFPCCRTCQLTAKPASANEPLWRKTANIGWLRAEWKFDFGHLLPEGFISYGVGVTPPLLQPERDRVFVFKPDFSRGYLDVDMEAHAQAGGDQHEARVKIGSFLQVNYPGEIVASRTGLISIAVPRTLLFGTGIKISERYSFQVIEMPYNLSNLVLDGDNIKVENGKVSFMGKTL